MVAILHEHVAARPAKRRTARKSLACSVSRNNETPDSLIVDHNGHDRRGRFLEPKELILFAIPPGDVGGTVTDKTI